MSTILESRQHVNPAKPQTGRDRSWHMMIHIQRKRHWICSLLKRACNDETRA